MLRALELLPGRGPPRRFRASSDAGGPFVGGVGRVHLSTPFLTEQTALAMVDRTALTDALQDPLTGLSTEWHFEIVSKFALGMASRGIPMTIASFAIDSLDTYADRKGQDARDSALQSFGTLLRRTARQTDIAVRMAEDRFLSLLMDCNLQGGLVFADRVRGQAAEFSADTGLTVSTGLATFIEEMESSVELLEMATSALAVAMASGGDCVKLPQDIE